MNTAMKRNRFLILVLSIFFVFGGSAVFAKKTGSERVKQEEGYYYGYGKGATLEEALLEGRRDLVQSALTAAVRAVNPKASKVTVSDESVQARIGNLKPHAQSKPKQAPSATFRIKIADWNKREAAYQDSLRADLNNRLNAGKNTGNAADKASAALDVLARLIAEGETELLTAQPSGSELISLKAEALCAEVSKSLVFEFSVKQGFVDSSARFSVRLTDSSGKPVSGFPLAAVWEAASLPSVSEETDTSEVRNFIKTDASGVAVVDYPASQAYSNRPVTLSVATAFTQSVPSSAALKKLDAKPGSEVRYVHIDDMKAAFASVSVPAGEFKAGAVAQDTRAGKKEASRLVTTEAYEIDPFPVTNAQYAAFIHLTGSETIPEYFGNSDYNQGKQPVVGLTAAEAEAYAAWLSEQTGFEYRLPTEEEWEKAARAGNETVYPWGDDNPAEQKKANYKGNGIFGAPSPVGAFENGINAWGLADMSGNVWEWTSSVHGIEGETNLRTVKGGSWMDGPMELRISNFRNIDSQNGYADVGFRLVRLVKEASE